MKVVSFDLLLPISLLPRSQPKERVGIAGRCAGDYFHLFVHLFDKDAIFSYNSGIGNRDGGEGGSRERTEEAACKSVEAE